jgi:hypothetical protein
LQIEYSTNIKQYRFLSDFDACEQLLKESMFCRKAMHDIRFKKHKEDLTLRLQEQTEAASVNNADYRIVPIKFQFSHWPDWTREEQIAHSYATDEERSAMKGPHLMTGCMFLRLKKE